MSRTYRSKHEADEFADSVKKKASNPREVQLKGYHIASLYCEVHEYQSALPYAESYVAIKPTDPRGLKLLGYIQECLKNPQKAIEGYRRSLELNENQKELVLKVAELYCEISYEPEKHRYWAERAEKYYPNHRIIHKIREHIFRSSRKLREFEKYLRENLRSNPNDIDLNISLVDVLLETNQSREGYQHCIFVEDSRLFESDPKWWQKSAVFYKSMISQRASQPDSVLVQAYGRLLLAVNSLVALGLSRRSAPPSHNMLQIQALDKVLLQTSDFLPTVGNALQRPQGDAVVQEVKGQLFFHLATLHLKMAVIGSVSLTDVIDMATACYLTSLHVPPVHELAVTKERMDTMTTRLRRLGAERMSEVCHMLSALVKQRDDDWLGVCQETCCNKEGRQRLFAQIYGLQNPDPRQSFLMMDDCYIQPCSIQLPDMVETVFKYDQVSIQGGTRNLQRLVWLGLQWDVRKDGILPDLGSFMEVTFERLAFNTRHLDNTSVDNLCTLDLEAFLYASIFVARAQLHNLNQQGLVSLNMPMALLVNCYSEEQLDWYLSVYSLYAGKARPSELAKFRLTAKKGLEVLRCQKNHGMETQLLIELGRTFNARMEELRSLTSDLNDQRDRCLAYQRVSVMYWQAALEQLKMLASNRAVPHPKKPLFSHVHKPLEEAQVQQYLDEGAIVIAKSHFEKGQHQVALSLLAKAKTPKALYTKAVMLHVMAAMETEGKSDKKITLAMLKKQGDLLDQAKYALYLTMDCIDMEPKNPLHEQVLSLLEEIEQEQATILDQIAALETNQSEISNLSSARQSLLGDFKRASADGDQSRSLDSTFSRSVTGVQTPSRQQNKQQPSPDPSPRRLAAELRALNLSHSHLQDENSQLRDLAASHNKILEQNQMLMQRQGQLMESNGELMKQILELAKELQEIKLQQSKTGSQSGAMTSRSPQPQAVQVAQQAVPVAQVVQVAQQQPHPQQLLASHQTASPSLQQTPSRAMYPPHAPTTPSAAYHQLDPNTYYHPHVVPASPVPSGQAWYPSAYGVPSPVPNPTYYAQHGYAIPYDHSQVHAGMLASTPRSTSRGPLESLYGMYSAIGSPPEDQSPEHLASIQGLKLQPASYPQRQLTVSGSAGAASMQAASPQVLHSISPGGSAPTQAHSPAQEYPTLKSVLEVDDRAMAVVPGAAGEKSSVMFKGGSITSGTPLKTQGAGPAVFSPPAVVVAAAAAAAAAEGFGTPDRGIENVTPPTMRPATSPFTATPKGFGSTDRGIETVTPPITQTLPQQILKPDASPMAGPSKLSVGAGAAQPPLTGFTEIPAASSNKPSQVFNTFSFSVPAVKPAAAVAKPVTTAASVSPFAGFSFGVTSAVAAAATPTMSTAGIFKPTAQVKFDQASPSVPEGAPVASIKPDLTQDPRSVSQYPGFYSSPTTNLGSLQGKQSGPATRKPGQSPLSRDNSAAKAPDVPKTVTFNESDAQNDDVIFVSRTQPTHEQRARAEQLQLPAGFYLYENAPPCKGCIGCLEDLDIDSLYKGGMAKAQQPLAVRPKEPISSSLFGTTAQSAASSSIDPKTEEGGFFGGGGVSGVVSFASLAATDSRSIGQGFGQGSSKPASAKPFLFANAGAPVFGVASSGGDGGDGDNGDEPGAEEDYDPQYEPIITLPEIGDISTGEEDEEEMYRHRAKLYRYDKNSKAWKERGVGDIKILRNPQTGSTRVLMRRDQVYKLCANHWITAEMDLKPMMSSETAWVWHAIDFSEEEPKNEQLAVKFKKAAVAHEFKEAFKRAQELLGQVEEFSDGEQSKPEEDRLVAPSRANPQLMNLLVRDEEGPSQKAEAPKDIWAAMGTKAVGSWDCDACYVSNVAGATTCVACQSPKPGSKAAKGGAAASPASVQMPKSNWGAFGAKPAGSWECDTCLISNKVEATVCAACETPKPGTSQPPSSGTTAFGGTTQTDATFKLPPGFSLGSKQPETTPAGASGGFMFSSPASKPLAPGATATAGQSSAFIFGSTASESAAAATTPEGTSITDKFTFNSGMQQFSFGGMPVKAPEANPSTGYSFGGANLTPQSKPAVADPKGGYPFSEALKAMSVESASTSSVSTPPSTSSVSTPPSKPSVSFGDLAKSQGSSFSFRLDINSITKSPKSQGNKSPKQLTPKARQSPGRGHPGTVDNEGEEDVEQGDDIYFEPLIQLPDNYEVKTGEEDEEVKFCHRAKLYRFDASTNQWKERGVGDIKILYSAAGNSYRIVMRRDQVLKVCANHNITPSLQLLPNAGSDRSWVWSAMDASEGAIENEQLAVRFKMVEVAQEFKAAIEAAKEHLSKKEAGGGEGAVAPDSTTGKQTDATQIKSCDSKLSTTLAEVIKSTAAQQKTSMDVATPLRQAGGSDEPNPEEERDIHFNPIIKLPERVNLVTGEEEEVACFVARGKLYRFDTAALAWKDRGVGEIKIMQSPETEKFRIVMRRDQIFKVCANHYITVDMELKPNMGSDRSWVWHAMDASDGEPAPEQLALRFKDARTAASFKEKFDECQAKLRQRQGSEGDVPQGTGKKEGDADADITPGGDATVTGQDQNEPGTEEQEEYEDYDDDDDDDVDDVDDVDDDVDDDDDGYEDGEENDDDDDDDDNKDEEDDDENPMGSLVKWIDEHLEGNNDCEETGTLSSSSGSSTSTSNSNPDQTLEQDQGQP